MKFSHFTSFSDRYTFLHHLLLALVSGGICLSSCEEDMDRPSLSSYVSFTSEISSSWTPSTRSTTNADALQGTVTTLQGGSTPLYLHTLYTDSIESPFSDSSPDTVILTRSAPIKDDNMYNSFGVSAYSYIGSWDESKTPNYFYNVAASKSGSGYNLSSIYYWPGASYKMKFFAYAPEDNGQYVLSGSTHSGSPTISVTIPGSVDDQKDLLVAKTDELAGNTNTAVPLTFHHALTAIRFVCGDDMQGGTVKSVSLKNVCSKGIYNMGTQSWSNVDTPVTFSQTLNKSTTGTVNEALTTATQTFMMIPQTLPDGAQLEVVFTDNSSVDHTLIADIKGQFWPIGKTVTYKISSSSINWTYTFTVSGPADFTYTGGTQQYSVTSYRQNTKGDKEPVRWSAQYSVDGGNSWTDNRPDWLTVFTVSGTGGETVQAYNATVLAQTGMDNNFHTSALQNATEKGTENVPFNLANQTNGGMVDENTANCYVVRAPGYYSFPLVYGNAIKNGATNFSAYISTAPSGPNILSNFINHTGNAITDPYISKNADCTPVKAELIWQDAMNLVTNIKYNNIGNGNISFCVNKNTIQQGNAVIAIKDANNNVLWSWHIWVTDEDINQTIEITNRQSKKYKFMPVNLGWCDGAVTIYTERSCKVRFTAGNQSQEIAIKQVSASITTVGGNNPYYQWGRKDPFLPSNGLNDTSKIWYDKSGVSSTGNPATQHFYTGATCIRNYILNPNIMQEQHSGDNLYLNLWDINNNNNYYNDDLVVKTIYDPSPVGFKLPDGKAFTGFTTTGRNTSTFSEINGMWDSSLKGFNFYTDSSKSKTIFFSASGYRYYSFGAPGYVGGYGYYWLANPRSQYYGGGLGFFSSSISLDSRANRALGVGVRPSQE
jgi:hypothetical protein